MVRKTGRGTIRRVIVGSRAVAAGLLLVALVAGCSGGSGDGDPPGPGGGVAAGGEPTTAAPTTTTSAVAPATLAISPKNGAAGQSVAAPVTVTAAGGTLSVVSLRNGDGEAVKGTLSADRTTWKSTEPLGYDKNYSVSATAENSDGVPTKGTSAFSTVKPRTFTLPSLFPGPDGPKTVGVGQPVTVRFDEPIEDKAAAEKTLTVTTSPQVAGSWHWFSDQVVHWRPKNYWAPGTKVTVKAAVYGVHVGDDVYGQQDVASSFTIGRSKIATVDDRTKQMVIKVDGRVVRTAPVSMGKDQRIVSNGKTINYLTQSGPHVVTEKHRVKIMSSASYGVTDKKNPNYYEEEIPLAVRISPDGEFVHAAPWSVWAQGKQNVSHGCINVAPVHAQWFFDNFSYGDVVDIRNTGRTLPFAAGYNEWGMPWSQWVAGSALK